MSREQAEKRARALEWLNTLRQNNPAMSRLEAIERTAVQFNLSPLEEEWLLTENVNPESRNPKRAED
jgi:hypothetical protein